MDYQKDIDALFQGSLADFVVTRNALAKRAGAQAGRVKALQKPNVPAWAVNQLYWRKRRVFDRLVAASLSVRAAYGAQFVGRASDVQKAETTHREAERAAMEEIRQMLRAAGESETSATLDAVRETLSALPTDDAPGRLTRPLKPQGLEALSGMAAFADKGARRGHAGPVIAVVPARTTADTERADRAAAASAAKAQADARRREVTELRPALREAKAKEAQAADALAATRAALDRASHERKRLQRELTDIVDRLHHLSKTAATQDAERQVATRTRVAIEQRLAGLSDAS